MLNYHEFPLRAWLAALLEGMQALDTFKCLEHLRALELVHLYLLKHLFI